MVQRLLDYTDFSKKIYVIKYLDLTNSVKEKKILCDNLEELMYTTLITLHKDRIFSIIEIVKEDNSEINEVVILLSTY